jgi:DNA invertase Pin-like site-specific DNA recombinase
MTLKPVIRLLRVSTEAQAGDDRASIPAQKHICEKIAQQYGLEIIATVELIDVSGTAVLQSPEMQQLLETIRRGTIHGVVAREFSRLMRPENFGDYLILQAFAESHTLLYLPDGPIDFANKMGRLMGTIRADIAGLERSEIQERMCSAKEQMRREGRWPNSERALPYGVGYDRKTCRWFYKPEAEKVREVFRRFLSGDTNYDALSEVLGLSRGSAKNVLMNAIYTGWAVYDEKRDPASGAKHLREGGRQGDRRKMARAPDEIIRVKVIENALISQSDFDRVQSLVHHKAEHNIRMRQKVGLFTYGGFVWCAKCGGRLHTWRNQFDRFYYVCSNKKRRNDAGENFCPSTQFMNRDKFEPKLDRLFGEQLTDLGFLRSLYEYQLARAKQEGSESRILRLRQVIERLESKRRRINDLYVDGEMTREERTSRLTQVDRELHQSREMLAAEVPMPVIDAEGLAKVFMPFTEWPYLSRAQRRRLLTSLEPQIKAADYVIEGLSIGLVGGHDMEATLQRLPHDLQHIPRKFGEFIEKQYPVVGQRDLSPDEE